MYTIVTPPLPATARLGSGWNSPGLGATRSRQRGSALLIVLAFIVILAVVLLAFLANSQRALQQTESSTTIVKTELLGEVATAAIIGDIKDEMIAGADEEPDAGEAMAVSRPASMVPSRVLKDTGMLTDPKFVNLVKQSVSGQPFFPVTAPSNNEGKKRASSAKSSDESRNQRKISAERWNKPQLLGDASGLGAFVDTQLPDWIYITRAGAMETGGVPTSPSDKTPSNTNYVLGRYAYNIYRVDGLLDINVAGFDPDNSKASTAAASKGSTVLADLRAIPGLESKESIQEIIQWRNKLTKDDIPAMIAGLNPGESNDADPNRWGEPGGFLQPYKKADGTGSDNRFFSRQDLLKYFSHQFSGGSEVASLPFLTTFSADLNQPSFRPDANRPTVVSNADGGGNNAYSDESVSLGEQINPPMLAVQDSERNPIVKSRFPLDRLKYVTASPQGEAAKNVEDYFGLKWNNGTWDYVAGDSDGTIKRLHELGGKPPNMIELLKAAIAIGSLGGQLTEPSAGRANILKLRDADIDKQVIRIAASIIDQYDSDSYPTVINFQGMSMSGVEDLPYLYGMRVGAYRLNRLVPADVVATSSLSKFPSGAAAANDFYSNVVMIQPILWNPHVQATGDSPPTQFRITASTIPDGGGSPAANTEVLAKLRWWATGSGVYENDLPMKVPDARYLDPRAFDPSLDYLTFNALNGTTSAFREPYTIKAPEYPVGVGAKMYDSADGIDGAVVDTTLASTEQNDTSVGESSTETVGFRAGYCWSGPFVSNDSWLQIARVSTGGITFELQCMTPFGWITYDKYEKFAMGIEQFDLGRYNHGPTYVNPRYMRYYFRIDPRTDRYGTKVAYMLPKMETAIKGMPQGQSLRKDDAIGIPVAAASWPADALAKYRFNPGAYYLGQLSENKATTGTSTYYSDPDGVKRLAMGGYAESGLDGLPMAQLNYSSRPVVLNRPFRSVAELSYVMRDQPWKQLDFFTPESGDAALLDIFCLYEPEDAEADPVVAGRVNLNTPRSEVIQALLRGIKINDTDSLSDSEAQRLAQALVDWTASSEEGKGPLRNRSELIGRYVKKTSADTFVYSGFSKTALDTVLTGANKVIPSRRQNVLRALVDPGTTRSWSFLVDLIVQDGQFIGTGTTAKDFMVRGEKRYWVHVAVDRFTGEVIAKRVEEVHE